MMTPGSWNLLPVTLAQAPGASGAPSQPTVGGADLPGMPRQGTGTSTPTTTVPTNTPPATQPAPGIPGGSFIWIIMALLAVMILTSTMGARKEKKRRAELLGSIKKYDKVQTIGGIIGTVQEIRDTEVVLKVDENSNTRIRFARSAIQQVIQPSPAGPESPQVEIKTTTDSKTAKV